MADSERPDGTKVACQNTRLDDPQALPSFVTAVLDIEQGLMPGEPNHPQSHQNGKEHQA
jgi:hypothetical protein